MCLIPSMGSYVHFSQRISPCRVEAGGHKNNVRVELLDGWNHDKIEHFAVLGIAQSAFDVRIGSPLSVSRPAFPNTPTAPLRVERHIDVESLPCALATLLHGPSAAPTREHRTPPSLTNPLGM